MKAKIIYIISIFFIFSSCVEEIRLKDDYTNYKLVVSSFITNGENVVVNLYKNKPINSKYEPTLKTKAKVVLYENGIEKETLETITKYSGYYDNVSQTYNRDSTYIYMSKNTEIKIGNTYKIIVECEGYETVSAETTVPAPVRVTGFDSLSIHKERHGSQYTEYNYKLSFTDPAIQTNYYRLVVLESFSRKSFMNLGGDTIWYIAIDNYSPIMDFSSSDPLLTNENKDANSYVFGELDNSYGIFSDEMIDGKPYELNFTTNYQNYYDNSKNIDYEAGEFRKAKLVLQSLNTDMYYYLRSIDAQEHSDYMMFTEPVPIYSNVENGFGVFGAYASSEVEIIYGEYPKEGVRYLTWEERKKLAEEYYNK